MPKVSIPDDFICPITHEIMKDPVATSDGQVYEREAIEAWLVQHDTSPITNEKLVNKALIPIPFVKKKIQGFLEKICSQEEFLEAIKKNDALSIEKLNYTHAHLEAKDQDGLTPIERAVYYGYENMIDFLKACKALKEGYVSNNDIYKYENNRYMSGDSKPLFLAAKNGYEKVVRMLLKENKYVQTRKSDCEPTPLHIAIENGHIEVVKALLDSGIEPNLSYDSYTNSRTIKIYPIHLAAIHGHVSILELLVKAGANIELHNNNSLTKRYNREEGDYEEVIINRISALIGAIYGNHIECVKFLVEAGADFETRVSFSIKKSDSNCKTKTYDSYRRAMEVRSTEAMSPR